MARPRKYWLMKSEPSVFSIEDLENSPNQTTSWEGVRNYQARNFMRDEMKNGDAVFFYHSNDDPQAIHGICEVVRESYPDPTQFDRKSRYFDPKATREVPRWYMVDIRLKKRLKQPITLATLRENRKLQSMKLLARGQRLSVQSVTESEWQEVQKLSR